MLANWTKTLLVIIRQNFVILHNAASILGTQVVTAGLGFIFWGAAARQFLPEAVGLAQAAIPAMLLLSNIGILGLGTLLVGELPRRPEDSGALISPALVTTAVASFVLGVGFAALAPILSHDLASLSANLGVILLFGAGVAINSVCQVIDQALVGLLRSHVQMWRNGIHAALKLAVLAALGFLLSDKTGILIYAVWIGCNLISLIYVAFSNLPAQVKSTVFKPEWKQLWHLIPTTFKYYLLTITLQLPISILPLIVVAMLGVKENAFFYMAWMITGFLFMVPNSLTLVLFAVGAGNISALAEKTRFTVACGLALCVAGAAALMLVAHPVLTVLGKDYADEGTAILQIMSIAVLPMVLRAHFTAICQVTGRMLYATRMWIIGGVIELILATIGCLVGGLPGLAAFWVVAVFIEGAMAAPLVYRTATSDRHSAPTPPADPIQEQQAQA